MPDDLTQRIIGAALEVHSVLGPGLLESTYEEALCHELELRSIPFRRQVPVDLVYKNRVIHGQRMDILIFDEVVVEIKAVRTLPEAATAQMLSYLRASGLKRGLLINFGAAHLRHGIKRVSL